LGTAAIRLCPRRITPQLSESSDSVGKGGMSGVPNFNASAAFAHPTNWWSKIAWGGNKAMLKLASTVRRRIAPGLISGAVAFCLSGFALASGADAQTPAPGKIPDLTPVGFAWLAQGAHWLDPPPGLGRGPIKQDSAYPYHGNIDGPGQVTADIGNTRDPVLKPWAARQMQESNDEVLTGKRGLPFMAQSACYPGGIPGQLITPAEPFYFIQKPEEVWMIWQRDHMVRRIYLTGRHSETVKPSWFGESIGHYESDGTLVVDTIGLSEQKSYLDMYRTPHTEKEHVVERYRLIDNGNRLEVVVMVEDPDAFNEPLYMVQRWRKVRNALLETVCAENNADHFGKNLFPVPQADAPDF
jgi:hypothetical protein